MNSEDYYIALCKTQIAEALNLSKDLLIQRDYEYLNKVIFEKSGIDLSTATLRRIWSEDREGIPQAKTLDAMAQVLDYDGWHEFKKANPAQQRTPAKKSFAWFYILGLIIIIGSAILYYWNPETQWEVELTPEKNSHEGVPATIGFNYNISEAPGEVNMQLSWNPTVRTVLDPEKNFYTGTYFYPDYHEAKLLFEEQILASSYVHITTLGWHGLIMQSGLDPHPIYIDEEDFILDSKLMFTDSLSEKYGLNTLDELFSVFTLSNSVLEQVSGDDFEMEATFKSLGNLSKPICSQTDILIKGETQSFRIPISSEGCYGITGLKCSEQLISGKTTDLSNLSANLLQNQTVSIKVSNKQLTISLEGKDPFIADFSELIGPIKVIKFIFIGYGEVSKFELRSSDQVLENEVLTPF